VQPGSCEGFVSVSEDPHTSDLAVGKLVDVGDLEVGIDSGRPSAGGSPHRAQNQLRPKALEILDLEPEVWPGVLNIGEEAPNPVRSLVGTLDLGSRGKQLHVLGATSQIAVDVTLVQCRNGPPDDLDISCDIAPGVSRVWSRAPKGGGKT
jgi:hypothetical protein